MPSVSNHSVTFRCEQGDTCEFFTHYNAIKEHSEPKVKLSTTSKVLGFAAQRGIWAGVGAATNYLSGGDPVAGALFNPLTSELNRGLNFVISKTPFYFVEKDISFTHIVKALTVKGVSMFAVASALDAFGYPVTKTTLVVNVIPRLALIGIVMFAKLMDAGIERMEHMHYHKIPCGCPDRKQKT